VSSDEQTQQADDPSGLGWRDVLPGEILQAGDMYPIRERWEPTASVGAKARVCGNGYRRRIEPQQPSDSEPDIVDDLRKRLAACEVLLAEAERSGQQVNAELQQLRGQLATSQHLAEMSRRQVQDEAGKVERLKEQVRDLTRQTQVDALELQQLREQVQTLTQERDRYRNQLAGAIEHSSAPEAQAQLVDRLQAWLRPVLEVVSDHPDHSSILAVSVMEFLPQIASRLIEE